jgi:hypothetical protein
MAKGEGNGPGRPPIVDEIVVQKLEQAFSNDLTDLEACLYAGISKATFYNYQRDNPEFLDRKEILKNALSLKAKNVLATSINAGNEADAKWWLERRRKDQFSVRNESTGANGGAVQHEHTIKNILTEIDGKTSGLPNTDDDDTIPQA